MANRRTIPFVIIIILLLIALMALFQNPKERSAAREITYTQFLMLEPHIRDIAFHGDAATGHDDKNAAFSVMLPHDPSIATRLAQNHVSVTVGPAEESQNWLVTLLVNGLPLVAYVFLLTWPLYRIARALDALTDRLDHQVPRPE